MAKLTFVGGIHPYDGKDLSKDKPIQDVLPKGEMVYPMSQHIGAPAKPIVAKGDRVLAGQKIAESGGFVSAPIYASVSGTVKSIETRRVVTGDLIQSIVIDNDGLYESMEFHPYAPVDKLQKDEIIDIVKEAGVVGMGGAGFPTHVKLSPKDPDKIDYVIANCAECEPYLTSDYRRMMEEPDKLIGGLVIDYGTPYNGDFAKRLYGEMLFNFGAYMTPQVAYMQTIGLETLDARYRVQSSNALELAKKLRTLPQIQYVNYVGLEDNPYHELAQRQFGKTAGAMICIDLESKEACFSFLNNLKLIHRATNLFDNRSLAIHPASTIFGAFSENMRKSMDVKDTTIRLSVGLEDMDDLFEDIKQAVEGILK